MKKLLLMAALFAGIASFSTASAQGGQGGDPQVYRQRMIERVKPQLVEKTKVSDAEADKVLDIYLSSMQQRRDLRMDNSTGEAEKAKKMEALNEENTKKYKAIPLKDEQVKAVNEFFEEMRKNMRNRGPQGGGR